MRISKRSPIAIVICSALIAACSSDDSDPAPTVPNAGGSQTNGGTVPVDRPVGPTGDTTGGGGAAPEPLPPPQPEPEPEPEPAPDGDTANAPNDPGDIAKPDGFPGLLGGGAGGADNPTPAPGGTASIGQLSQLFGNLVFAYRFVPDGNRTYFLQAQPDESAIAILDDGTPVIAGTVPAGFQLDGEDALQRTEDQFTVCLETEAQGFLCLSEISPDSRDVLLFPYLSNGRASGIYELCTPENNDRCVEDLVNTPDGTVMVINEPAGPMAAYFGELPVQPASDPAAKLNAQLYAVQGSPSLEAFGGTRLTASPSLAAAYDRLSSQLSDKLNR